MIRQILLESVDMVKGFKKFSEYDVSGFLPAVRALDQSKPVRTFFINAAAINLSAFCANRLHPLNTEFCKTAFRHIYSLFGIDFFDCEAVFGQFIQHPGKLKIGFKKVPDRSAGSLLTAPWAGEFSRPGNGCEIFMFDGKPCNAASTYKTGVFGEHVFSLLCLIPFIFSCMVSVLFPGVKGVLKVFSDKNRGKLLSVLTVEN
ncbi:hypothetical protein [uncultured Desulfobacter sp.]|uniref:hypothetical protein n=1 Tax=uncultured Desulfobacter sp. TaxID=240139 RepID=UPI002AAB5ABC|nr:hypothetical protein [uncultured Desulfobacter sp.]